MDYLFFSCHGFKSLILITSTIPHPLNPPTSTICLITVDPQRAFKNAIADPSFSESLRKRITRVIGVGKLRLKYKSYESRRQLHREHDIFLADDRVLPQLPRVLGKIFYKGTSKRPVPVCLSGGRNDRQLLQEGEKSVAKPAAMANEIERTLSTALIHLSPSTSTSIRVGRASWDEILVVENIEAVVDGLIRTFISRKWRNIKALHVKGPSTAALPVYMTKELWVDEEDILDGDAEAKALGAWGEDEDGESGDESSEDGEQPAESRERKKKGKKRDDETATNGNDKEEKKARKKVKREQQDEENNVDRGEKERKKTKKRHREEDEGVADLDEVPRETKKAKKKVKKEDDEEGAANGDGVKLKKEKKKEKEKKKKNKEMEESGLEKGVALWKEKLKKQKADAMGDAMAGDASTLGSLRRLRNWVV